MTDKTELEKARGDLASQAHTLEEACYWTKQNGKGSVPILAVQEFINVVRTHREAAEAEIKRQAEEIERLKRIQNINDIPNIPDPPKEQPKGYYDGTGSGS